MKKILYPDKKRWEKLIQRPQTDNTRLTKTVLDIFEDIRKNGDKALHKYSNRYDKVKLKAFELDKLSIAKAEKQISEELRQAILIAKSNIERFHLTQTEEIQIVETMKGVKCWRESRAIEKVGIYIPGGSAPLFSTVLMLGIPARIAGCKDIILCTPPDKNGEINPAIIYCAELVGIKKIYKLGGIQAIGAMSFGTASIPKVDKIFGPGNQYVTAAKQMAQNMGRAIDMPAGPSEVLVIADAEADAEFVAADLLSQAEHGEDSQVMLLSDNKSIVENSLKALKEQLKKLPRKQIAQKALDNSKAIVLKSIEECIAFSNFYAPEHLILATKDYKHQVQNIIQAGSVFLGPYSCESAGDYASGTNHTLPTNAYARSYSGVSVDSFIKKISFQEISPQGIRNIGPAITIMAAAEQLEGHKNAVSIRLNKLKK